ncbi:MAG TPA: hypothetical protein VGM39_05695 [Kofleriaceae bacterium]
MRGWLFALIALSSGLARADEPGPTAAEGTEAAISLGAGGLLSKISTAGALEETGSLGSYVATSSDESWSVEAIETVAMSTDVHAPLFGAAGVALRRLGGFDIERLSLGLAWGASHGSSAVGGAVGAAFGLYDRGGSGVVAQLDAYVFASDLGGVNRMVMISLAYSYSPITGRHAAPRVIVGPPSTPEEDLTIPACPDLQSYRETLVQHRTHAVAVCGSAPDSKECNTEQATVEELQRMAMKCSKGER